MKTLFLFAFLFSPLAHAAVSGTWQGNGQWGYEGSAVDCTMKMEYWEGDAELKRIGGKFDCGFVGMHSDPLTWKKEEGGRLSIGGAEAGTISDQGFYATEDYEDGIKVQTKFSYQGNAGSYEERWIDKTGREIYLIRGQLQRKPRP